MTENRAVAERFLAARERRDVEACLSLLTEDAVWHSPIGPPERGRDGFRCAIEQAYTNTRWFVTETLGVQDDGSAVVARIRNRGERDGERLDSVQRLIFRFNEARITDVRVLVDDPAAVAEFWIDDES